MRNTIENLYNSYGAMFDMYDEFKQHFMKTTKEKYVAMLYMEKEDERDKNYIAIQAPAAYPKYKFKY
jgi:hypothetical protein